MSEWAEGLLSCALVWVALVLTVPKRDWCSAGQRLRAASMGERRHAFGPPAADEGEGTLRLARRLFNELPRCFELGIPLWLVTLRAERAGDAVRAGRLEAWTRSPAGWTWSLLRGELTEEALLQELASRELPLPSTKACYRAALRYTMPPVAWLAEHKVDAMASRASPAGAAEVGRTEQADGPRLVISTLGRFAVFAADGRELTAELTSRPVVSYVFQFTMLKAMLGKGRAVSRAALAEEVYVGRPQDEGLTNLRKRLHNFRRQTSRELSRVITINDREVGFDLEACSIDALHVLQLASKGTGEPESWLSQREVTAIEKAIGAASDEFLAGWEELQHSINRGRGAGGDLVRDLRIEIEEARVTLLISLASHQIARRRLESAIAALDQAFRLDPGRPGLAGRLANALDAAGETDRAADVRRGSEHARQRA